jgi:hypothetical protein
MYTCDVKVIGVAPLMQHRFPIPDFGDLHKGGTKHTGAKDYSQEWREYLYLATNGDGRKEIYQPATHFESAMTKAAVSFKISGNKRKTYKDLFKANVFVSPEKILHGVMEPKDLDPDADKQLYLDIRPVVIQRSRIVRMRPTFKSGWKLEFNIEVIDDQVPSDIIQEVLTLAGQTVGIGDYRPRFGRFRVARFEVVD